MKVKTRRVLFAFLLVLVLSGRKGEEIIHA